MLLEVSGKALLDSGLLRLAPGILRHRDRKFYAGMVFVERGSSNLIDEVNRESTFGVRAHVEVGEDVVVMLEFERYFLRCHISFLLFISTSNFSILSTLFLRLERNISSSSISFKVFSSSFFSPRRPEMMILLPRNSVTRMPRDMRMRMPPTSEASEGIPRRSEVSHTPRQKETMPTPPTRA